MFIFVSGLFPNTFLWDPNILTVQTAFEERSMSKNGMPKTEKKENTRMFFYNFILMQMSSTILYMTHKEIIGLC
jgi:hypothetical protein